MSALDAPLPPLVPMRRVGHGYAASDDEVAKAYLEVGAEIHGLVSSSLPPGWDPAGKRILDFGAGAGRALRHFGAELEAGAELWGCDIDGPSIEWANEHLAPCRFFQNGEAPPLDVPDEHFDLVIAMSVFTHITRHWADWLIELHRVMKPGGILIASYLGPSMHRQLLDRPYDDSRVGMLVLRPGASWDEEGGPLVFHSPWWLKRHWSPAFELSSISDAALSGDGGQGHGVVVGRRTDERPTRETLTAPAPSEPREASAALHNVELLCAELEAIRRGAAADGAIAPDALGQALARERTLHDEAGRLQESLRESAAAYEAALDGARGEVEALRAELAGVRAALDERERLLDALERSASWRLTAPLRRAKRLAGRRRA